MLAIDLSKIGVCSVIKQLHISRSFSTKISRVALVHHAHGSPEEVVRYVDYMICCLLGLVIIDY